MELKVRICVSSNILFLTQFDHFFLFKVFRQLVYSHMDTSLEATQHLLCGKTFRNTALTNQVTL